MVVTHLVLQWHCLLRRYKGSDWAVLDEAIDHGKTYLSIANIEQTTVNPAQFFEEACQSSLWEGLEG